MRKRATIMRLGLVVVLLAATLSCAKPTRMVLVSTRNGVKLTTDVYLPNGHGLGVPCVVGKSVVVQLFGAIAVQLNVALLKLSSRSSGLMLLNENWDTVARRLGHIHGPIFLRLTGKEMRSRRKI